LTGREIQTLFAISIVHKLSYENCRYIRFIILNIGPTAKVKMVRNYSCDIYALEGLNLSTFSFNKYIQLHA